MNEHNIKNVALGCRCGKLQGSLTYVSPNNCNRVICYCEDCRAFLHHLGRVDLLDAAGGTEVIQVAPQTVTFEHGTGSIACVRLTPNGLYRWYANCCNTPLGNTLTPSVPFIGMPWEVFRGAPDTRSRDESFGKVRAASFSKSAQGQIQEGVPKAGLKHLLHMMRLMLEWKIRGKAWPHPFFDRNSNAPKYPIAILSSDERKSLQVMSQRAQRSPTAD